MISQFQNNTHKTLSNTNALYCRFHPHNQLHTFCISKECLLPMCSACMTVHNVDHCESSTYGNYIDTYTNIEEVQRSLEQLSSTYVQDYTIKNNIPQETKALLSKTRRKAHEEIDRIFDRIDLDSMEKMSMFIDQMENQYLRIENELHQFYETLQVKKNKLRRNNTNKGVNKSIYLGAGAKIGEIRQEEDEENRKADHRILKTLIEYYHGKEEQINKSKVNGWSHQIEKLQKVEFRVEVDFERLGQFLKEACYGITTINGTVSNNTPKQSHYFPNQLPSTLAHNQNLLKPHQSLQEEKVLFNQKRNSAKEQEFQTQRHQIKGPFFQINEISKNTQQRLSKLNIDNKKYSTQHEEFSQPTMRNRREISTNYDQNRKI